MFSGTRGPHNAKILVVGEAYGAYEAAKGQPFVGPSGMQLDRMLSAAGIPPHEVLFTNVINKKPLGNEFTHFLLPGRKHPNVVPLREVFFGDELQCGLEELRRLIAHMKPSLIIGCGNWPLWALTDKAEIKTVKGYRTPGGIMKWRGSQLWTVPPVTSTPIPYLPIIHPAMILRTLTWEATTIQDLRRWRSAISQDWTAPTYNFTPEPRYQDAFKFFTKLESDALNQPQLIAVDIETNARRIRSIAFARSPHEAICIPLFKVLPEGGSENYWTAAEFPNIHKWIRRSFSNPNVSVIGQNFLYDLAYISLYFGVTPQVRFDTMLAQHLCFPGTTKSLDYLSSLYCSHHVYWKDDLHESSLSGDEWIAWRYNCEDAARTYEIYGALAATISSLGLTSQWAFQMEYFWTCFDKSTRGVRIDIAARATKYQQLLEYIGELRGLLETYIPSEFLGTDAKGRPLKTPWYNSPIQTASLLYTTLGLKPILHKKTHQPTTDDSALAELSKKYRHLGPIFSTLMEYRSAGVFLSTFLTAELDPDGRMRSSFNLGGTETFRLSSSANPFGRGLNFQNIPSLPTED